jgi:hypothetical protein
MKKGLPMSAEKRRFYFATLSPRIILTGCFVCFCCFVNAQSYEIGVQGSAGAAWFYNPNFLKSGTDQGYRINVSDNYGLHAAINLPHGYTLEMDILNSSLRQGYGSTFGSSGSFPLNGISYSAGEKYTASSTINVIDIPIILRMENTTLGNYFLIGMGYEMVSSATYSANYSAAPGSIMITYTEQCPKGNFLLMAGIGREWRLFQSDFHINAELRLDYRLIDVQGVDGHGQEIKFLDLYNPSNVSPNPYYSEYHGTHPIELSFNVGVFYRFYSNDVHRKVMQF